MTTERAPAKPLTGWHVFIVTAIAFGLVFAVNITFVVLSLKTFTGEDVSDAYSRGLAYNDVIEERAAQAARGWTVALGVSATETTATRITMSLTDADGAPVSRADVTILFRRATHEGEDTLAALIEQVPGAYAAEIHLPGAGTWDVRGQITRGEDERLDFEDRLWVE